MAPAQAFLKAGVPAGVVNLVTGKGSEIGDFLTTHPAVNCIRCVAAACPPLLNVVTYAESATVPTQMRR